MNEKRFYEEYKLRWENWKLNNLKKIEGLSPANSKILLDFLKDMEIGQNVSTFTKKGERSYTRLYSLKDRIVFFGKTFKNKPFDKITKNEIHEVISKMRKGEIVKSNGKPYKATGEYVKDFKSLWGWMRRTGRVEEDITQDLARKDEKKPAWVYLGEEKFKTLANSALSDYRVLLWFAFDSGARPQELFSIKINDFSKDFTEVHIRQEYAKVGSFGRKIKLKLCTSLIKEYVKVHNLKSDDYLILKKLPAFNKYLGELAKRLFGDEISEAREKYSNLTLYDVRHNSACYWLPRYPKTGSLMYRFGWKTEKEIAYYSEFLGMSDQLRDEDMIINEDKTKLDKVERELADIKKFLIKAFGKHSKGMEIDSDESEELIVIPEY